MSLNSTLPKYGINTELRVAAFLATVTMESDFWKATEEYASGIAYDITRNRAKAIALGNTEKGDGVKYKGRTGIQTTGKKNYARLTKKIGKRDGIDFVKNPEKLSENKYFVEGACVYWEDNDLNSYADKGKFFAIQGLVNRGDATKTAKDYTKRLAIYDTVLRILPSDFNLSSQKTNLSNSTEKMESRDSEQSVTGNSADKISIEKAADTLSLSPLGEDSAANLGGAPTGTDTDTANSQLQNQPPPPDESVVVVSQARPEIDEIKDELKAEAKAQVKTRFLAIPGMILGLLGALWERIVAGETNLVYWLVGAVVVILIAYIGFNKWQDYNERKTALEKERHDKELKLMREAQAHELTKIQAESAMRRDLQTIKIAPNPIRNSDSESS